MIKHIRRWNIWKKNNKNSPFHKFLVLVGFIKSPTMPFTLLPEESQEIEEVLERSKEEYRKMLHSDLWKKFTEQLKEGD